MFHQLLKKNESIKPTKTKYENKEAIKFNLKYNAIIDNIALK